jgi:hypothetical protein
MREFGKDFKGIADQFRAAGDAGKAALLPTLEAAAAQFSNAKSAVAGFAAALRPAATAAVDAGKGLEAVSAHAEHGGIATAGFTREVIVLGHEMLQGNFSKIPGSMMVLAERTGGLHTAMASLAGPIGIAIAGFAAFGIALYEAASSIAHFRSEAEGARAAFSFAGVDQGRAQVDAWITQVKMMPGATGEAAQKVVSDWAQIRDATPQLVTAILDYLPVVSKGLGVDLPQANERLIKSFKDLGTAGQQQLQSLTGNVDTIKRFNDAVVAGSRADAMAILLTQISQNAEATDKTLNKSALTARSFGQTLALAFAGAAGGGEQLAAIIDKLDDSKLAKIRADLAAALSAPTTKPTTASPLSEITRQATEIRDSLTASNAQIAADTVALWERQRATAIAAGEDLKEIDANLARARLDAAKAGGTQLLADTRTSASDIAASDRGSATERIAAEKAAWGKILDDTHLSYDQRQQAQREFNSLSAQLSVAEHAERLAAIRTTTEGARQGTDDRLHGLAQLVERDAGDGLQRAEGDAGVGRVHRCRQDGQLRRHPFRRVEGDAREGGDGAAHLCETQRRDRVLPAGQGDRATHFFVLSVVKAPACDPYSSETRHRRASETMPTPPQIEDRLGRSAGRRGCFLAARRFKAAPLPVRGPIHRSEQREFSPPSRAALPRGLPGDSWQKSPNARN